MEVRKRTIFQAIFCGDIPWNLAMKLSHVAAMWEFGAFCWHQKNLDMHRCRLPPDGEPARWGILTNWKMNTYFMTQILPLFSCYSMLFLIVWWWWHVHHSSPFNPHWIIFIHHPHHSSLQVTFVLLAAIAWTSSWPNQRRRSLRGISWGFHGDFNGEIYSLVN